MDRCFTPKNCAYGIRKFVSATRRSLIAVGKSPDCHVYELNRESLRFVKKGIHRRHLTAIISFYNALEDELSKRIFVTEILEPGRHYLFWHYGVVETPIYKNMIQQIYDKVNAKFKLEA